MANQGGFSQRRLPFRKRLRRLWSFPFIFKQLAWRGTATWIWFYAFAALIGKRTVVNGWNDALFVALAKGLTEAGFAPSNPSNVAILCKAFWLLAITSFSFTQIVGFFLLYLPLAPMLLVFSTLRKQYRKTREDSFSKARRDGNVLPRKNTTFALLFLLFMWFILYVSTPQKYPLFVGMLLTALLFITRVNRALVYATTVAIDRTDRVDAFFRGTQKFISQSIEQIKNGEVTDIDQLGWMISMSKLMWRLSHFISRSLYGKAAKRRAALIELLTFMGNLAILGSLSVLFWALAIKYSALPLTPALAEALLASASRAIPGVPDSSNLHVGVAIQTFASLTPWIIFVLYAGPVASLFPTFQERSIVQTAQKYNRMREARKEIYRLLVTLRAVRQFLLENPAIISFTKNVSQLRRHINAHDSRIGQSREPQGQSEKPEELKLMEFVRVQLPKLEDLVRELSEDAIAHATGRTENTEHLKSEMPETTERADNLSTRLSDGESN